MSMKLDYLPTDVCPTIKDACGEVRLVDPEADVDVLRSDNAFGSFADAQCSLKTVIGTTAMGSKAVVQDQLGE